MKNLKIIAFCLFSLVFLMNIGCKNKNVNTKEINLKLDSLSLNGKSNIEQNLAKENGVIFVKAHLRKQVVTIVYDTTKENIVTLMGALEKMGYKTQVTMPPVPGNNN